MRVSMYQESPLHHASPPLCLQTYSFVSTALMPTYALPPGLCYFGLLFIENTRFMETSQSGTHYEKKKIYK